MHIREKRKEKGLTLKELGIRVGCSESAMSQYETGKRNPDYETLLKIAEELDTTVVYLLTGSTEDQTTQTQLPELTTEEKDFVEKFRGMNDEEKNVIRIIMSKMNATASMEAKMTAETKVKKDTEIS